MRDRETILFATSSTADFGFANIILTSGSADHISRGHRDIGALPFTLIKEAIEQTTQVYSSHMVGRLLFVSTNVSRGNYPMTIVVERVQTSGKIITATWKDRVSGSVIWDSTNNLYTDFDSDADVLYVSRGPAVASYAAEDDQNPDIWYRYAIEDNSHTGVTIFRAKEFIGLSRGAQIASSFLGVSELQIRERLNALSF
jgi:hypothetical protein